MTWPRSLITPAELAVRLDAPELRLIECGVVFRILPDGSDFRLESARSRYDSGHLPGAVFVDPVTDLSDPASGLRFTMPAPARVAEAFGRHGVGPGTFTWALYTDTIPADAYPVAEVTFPPGTPGGKPITRKYTLKDGTEGS